MSDLLEQYLKAGSLGLVAATALVGLVVLARLFLKRNDAYIAATKEQQEKFVTALEELRDKHAAALKSEHDACVSATAALHEQYTNDLHDVEKENRKELQALLQEFITSAKNDREDYRKIIERTTTILEAFLSRYDGRRPR